MPIQYRRMRPYYPRKRSSGLKIQKQQLYDWQHKLSGDIGSLIVFIEEGQKDQVEQARIKAKSNFHKFAPEMQKLASGMGEKFAKAVREYLDSIDTIIHSEPGWLDDEKIKHCYTATEKLEKEIKVA